MASDRAGNVGQETFHVFRDTVPPDVWVSAPARVTTHTVPLTWGGQDGASGLAWYDVDLQVDAGAWQRVLTHTQATAHTFTNLAGDRYTFRVTATDNVGNAATAERVVGRVQITKYYYHGGQRVALRQSQALYFLHSDHLGSTSLTTDAVGNVVAQRRYAPYGKERWAAGASPTNFGFTGQRDVPGTGLMYYRARYYHPALGRFISADSIVPGAASGAGGGAAALGYDPKTRLTPLTVNLGEFAEQINAENREILQFGWFFQWNVRTRREHNVPSGPVNPQALNRYAYVLNNPLRYVDPTGHDSVGNGDIGAGVLLDEQGNEVTIEGKTVYKVWYFGTEMYVLGDDPNLRIFMDYARAYNNACSDESKALRNIGIRGGVSVFSLMVTGIGAGTAATGVGVAVGFIGVLGAAWGVTSLLSAVSDWSHANQSILTESKNAGDVFLRMIHNQVLIP